MTESKKPIAIQALTKSLLIRVLGISKSQFHEIMKHLEKELIKEFPRYERNMKILPLDVFFWLCNEIQGLDKQTVINRIIEVSLEYRNENIERIEKIYGLNKENRF